MYFLCSLDLSADEGGRNVELIPGGRSIEVNEQNVYEYVRKYAEYRMVRSQYKALEELRNGVYDLLPASALDGKIFLGRFESNSCKCVTLCFIFFRYDSRGCETASKWRW